MNRLNHSIKRILIAAGLATAVAAPTWAAEPETDVSPDSAAHAQWRATMAESSAPSEGCFHASYPDIVWEKMDCTIAKPRVRPVHVNPSGAEAEVVGNTKDFVAKATGLITLASGGFATKGVTSETGVGVAAFSDEGILGANEYSLQLNTNALETTSACAGHSGCTVWQQFVYSPDFIKKGTAGVLMQYWLIDWGTKACPAGWDQYKSDCFKNSPVMPAPDLPITDLGKEGLEGTATAGGNDTVTFSYGTESYSVSAKDSVLDISSVWNKAEFNVFGNAGGSRADFNSGSSITVTLLVLDGSTSAPTCVSDDGTTGETNNLNLGTCKAFGGIPNIQFTESN
jgi:hypothetical protein